MVKTAKNNMSSSDQKIICVCSSTEELHRVRDFIQAKALELGFSEQGCYNITLAVDEACSNVIRHTYRNNQEQEFCIEVYQEQEQLIIKIMDSGATFNPLSLPLPKMQDYFKKFMKGGLGVPIIRKLVDQIEYIPADASQPFNILKLIKTKE